MKQEIIDLISNYKDYIGKSKMQDEVYKWELIKKYSGRPAANANDFTAEIKSIKFDNLIYRMSIAVINNLAKSKPEELRELFKSLYDESKSLKERIINFNVDSLALYRSLGEKLGHHQDERAIATYLTFHNPEKYTLYKSTFYKKFCLLLGVKPAGKNEKYIHYLELLNEFIEKYIITDKDLINEVKGYIPEHYDGENHLLLAQDIMFCMLNANRGVNEDKDPVLDLSNETRPKDEKRLIYRLSKIGKEDSVTFYEKLKTLINHLGVAEGEKRVCYNLPKSVLLGLTVGQKYALILTRTHEANTVQYMNTLSKSSNWLHKLPNVNQLKKVENIYTESAKNELTKTTKTGYEKSSSTALEKSLFDDDYRKYIFDLAFENGTIEEELEMKEALNTILYGPPGTGKTYNTINKALELIGEDIEGKKRHDIVAIFKRKIAEGQIVFTTFHQSFAYEDFIEGIKPVIEEEEATSDGELSYVIENGVFKELVERINNAQEFIESDQKNIYIDPLKFKNSINKVSLGNSLDAKDDVIYDYCMNNDCIVIGFGEDIDFSGVKNRIEIRKRFQDNGIDITSSMDFNISAMERLVLWMEPGQLVFVSDGNSKLKAIGEISGDYYCDPSAPIRYAQFRKVKWLYKDLALPIQEIYGKKFSQQTIYQIDSKHIDQSYFSKNDKKKDASNYVLIIDEINRGNVSSIFGELITLIEPDKRKGEAEELSAILPYSKKPFSVPNNLYILGTMNTADRSVEALDTALRRRFSFVEMLPDHTVLATEEVGGIQLSAVLKKINERVEILVDRDHTIGHSYFIGVDTEQKLVDAFKDKIVPLLQEYFYGDYGKIGLVLGNGFVSKEKGKNDVFADFEYDGQADFITDSYKLSPINKTNIVQAVTLLLNDKKAEA